MTTRVLLADDHKLFRDGLRALIEVTPGFAVAGEAKDGLEALELCRSLRPEVMLLDISMPAMNGIEVARRLHEDGSSTRVLILSMHSDRRYVAECLRAGAHGYLLKDSPFPEVARAMRAVLDGHVHLSPSIADVVAQEFAVHAHPSRDSAFDLLSAREREVLQLLAEGQGTKEIAARLSVSGKTIETHRRQLMEKLGLHSVAELTKYAVRQGLTPLE